MKNNNLLKIAGGVFCLGLAISGNHPDLACVCLALSMVLFCLWMVPTKEEEARTLPAGDPGATGNARYDELAETFAINESPDIILESGARGWYWRDHNGKKRITWQW